ncbi:MAG: 2-C-methyl-D-erythritol 2,4-cyclodiphosphate synthase, partial [Burkholderiales bacterium]
MLRIGQGFDLHRLVENRPLILGGVTIPFTKGLAGHSDADVLVHAVIDALIGALALGDIGKFFPDTDESYANIDSRILLRKVSQEIHNYDYKLSNLDATIIIEQPKLRNYIDQMRNNLAADLMVDLDQINIKAKTSEAVGMVG